MEAIQQGRYRMKRIFIIVPIVLSACVSQGDQEAEKYRVLATTTGSQPTRQAELCDQAQLAAQAYQAENNPEEYAKWKVKSDLDCASDAEWEHLAS